MRRLLPAVLAIALPLAMLGACASKPAAEEAAPAMASPSGLENPQATGEMLIREWLDMLNGTDTDMAALELLLAPNFQLQRDDGSRATKDEYLAEPATVNDYDIGELRTEVAGGERGASLTVTFQLTVDEVINGVHHDAIAPRLGTFIWAEDDWQLLSWANFGTLSDDVPITTDDDTGEDADERGDNDETDTEGASDGTDEGSG